MDDQSATTPDPTAHAGLPPWVMKCAITGSVIFSFVWATLGHARALQLWREDWLALKVYLGLGLGLSWARDILATHARARLTEAQAASRCGDPSNEHIYLWAGAW